ncbi:MAG: hypothetical protein F6K41_13445 [Symploca sp. SIO3E6]|nr:hypothetical protein [Caldora sp. SIO3E6]
MLRPNPLRLNVFLYSQFPIPNSQFPIPNSQFPIPNSQFPIPLFLESFKTLRRKFSIIEAHPQLTSISRHDFPRTQIRLTIHRRLTLFR